MSYRSVTAALAVGWAAVALLLSVYANLFASGYGTPFETTNVSGRITVSWVAPEAAAAGLEPGDQLQAVDGVSSYDWTRARRFDELEPGRANRYTFERRDGTRFEITLEPIRLDAQVHALAVPLYAAILLVGLTYLGLGALVWQLRRGREEAWAFLVFSCAMAVQLFTSHETFLQVLGYERTLWNLFLLGAATFHLFTTYPFEPPWVVERPWLRRVPYWLAAAAAPLVLLERPLGVPGELLQATAFFSVVVLAFGCVGFLTWERLRNPGHENADRADVMLLGALLSFVPVVALVVAEQFVDTGIPVAFPLLWFAAFPISVAWGIVRKQLFDIRNVARSSVAYGAATVAITGVYALLIASADYLVTRFNVNARSPQFSVVFLFFAILAFNPLRNRTQGLVDRLFDRDRLSYREAVREISEAMVSMLSVKEIVDRIVRTLTQAMGVERAMVLLLGDDERVLRLEAHGGAPIDGPEEFELSMDHPVCKLLWMRREEVSRAEVAEDPDERVRAACLEVFDRLEVALLVPVLFGVDMLGVIAVGRKSSGDRFHADDRQLLLTLANQSSIAIENAKAFDEIAKLNETLEARVEERTRELQDTQSQLMQSEKMRTLGQLVAGVAHELNNPIGFVHANLKLLDEYVAKLSKQQEDGVDTTRAREAIAKLIARSREGTDRVKDIVADLRTFSRTDQAELQEADLNDEIERTVGLMEPRCKCGIEVERDYGELPRVRCHAGQLNQVFLNLLMNSCDALGEKGRIRIRTRARGDGVLLEFEDDGPGIPPDVRDRIFEPFFTTKPVGQGTGLGLSLSHGIIERHGGRIAVESEAGAGTRFVIELPLRGAEPSEDASEASSAA